MTVRVERPVPDDGGSERLSRVLHGMVTRTGIKLGFTCHESEDLRQEVFLKICRRAVRDAAFLPQLTSRPGLLRAIVRRTAVEMLRRRTREVSATPTPQPDELPEPETGDGSEGRLAPRLSMVERQFYLRELRAFLIRALALLPPLHGETLLLKYLDGRHTREVQAHVMEALGVSRKTAKVFIARAERMLRLVLRGRHPREIWPEEYAGEEKNLENGASDGKPSDK